MKIILSNYDEINNPYYGGGGAIANHKIASLLSETHEVVYLCGKFKNSRDRVEDGVKYKHIGSTFAGSLLGQVIFSLLLPVYVLISKFDLWIENFVPPHSTNFLPIFTNKPVVGVTSLMNAKKFSKKYKFPFHIIEKLGLKLYDNIIVLNDEFKKRINRENKKTKVKVIPRGVDQKYFDLETSERDYILYLGRLDIFQKGIDLLLNAWKEVAPQNPNVKLIIAGKGNASDEAKIRNIATNLSISNSVEFVGHVSGKKKLNMLAKCICVVVPSRFEGFGNTALEALATGKPLVVYDIKSLKWMPNEVCLKVKNLNSHSLSSAIIKVLNDKSARKDFSIKSRSFAKSFKWEKIAQEYKCFFEKVIESDLKLDIRKLSSLKCNNIK